MKDARLKICRDCGEEIWYEEGDHGGWWTSDNGPACTGMNVPGWPHQVKPGDRS